MTVTVSVLMSSLDAELRRLGYKDSTLVWYRRCWRRLEGSSLPTASGILPGYGDGVGR